MFKLFALQVLFMSVEIVPLALAVRNKRQFALLSQRVRALCKACRMVRAAVCAIQTTSADPNV